MEAKGKETIIDKDTVEVQVGTGTGRAGQVDPLALPKEG
jgi:hypothetical protein